VTTSSSCILARFPCGCGRSSIGESAHADRRCSPHHPRTAAVTTRRRSSNAEITSCMRTGGRCDVVGCGQWMGCSTPPLHHVSSEPFPPPPSEPPSTRLVFAQAHQHSDISLSPSPTNPHLPPIMLLEPGSQVEVWRKERIESKRARPLVVIGGGLARLEVGVDKVDAEVSRVTFLLLGVGAGEADGSALRTTCPNLTLFHWWP